MNPIDRLLDPKQNPFQRLSQKPCQQFAQAPYSERHYSPILARLVEEPIGLVTNPRWGPPILQTMKAKRFWSGKK